MVNCHSCVEAWQPYFCPKAISGYKLISIIIHHNVGDLFEGFFVLAFNMRSSVMKGAFIVGSSIACSKINADDKSHFHSSHKEIRKFMFGVHFYFLNSDRALTPAILLQLEAALPMVQLVYREGGLSNLFGGCEV